MELVLGRLAAAHKDANAPPVAGTMLAKDGGPILPSPPQKPPPHTFRGRVRTASAASAKTDSRQPAEKNSQPADTRPQRRRRSAAGLSCVLAAQS